MFSVEYYPTIYNPIESDECPPSEGICDLVFRLDNSYDDNTAISLKIVRGGSTFYLDGEGGLDVGYAVTYTPEDWACPSSIYGVYPRSTVLNLLPSGCTAQVASRSITLANWPFVASDIPMNLTRLHTRTRWEARGLVIDDYNDALYKDMAQLLGVYNSSGVMVASGLLSAHELEIELDREAAFGAAGSVTTNMETLSELQGNPIFSRFS